MAAIHTRSISASSNSSSSSSSSIYSLKKASRSSPSLSSISSESSSWHFSEPMPFSSSLGCLHHASPEATSSIVQRLIPKSMLAKRIAKARKAARESWQHTLEQEISYESRKRAIQARFLQEEKQWKQDAIVDQTKRIIEGMQRMGI